MLAVLSGRLVRTIEPPFLAVSFAFSLPLAFPLSFFLHLALFRRLLGLRRGSRCRSGGVSGRGRLLLFLPRNRRRSLGPCAGERHKHGGCRHHRNGPDHAVLPARTLVHEGPIPHRLTADLTASLMPLHEVDKYLRDPPISVHLSRRTAKILSLSEARWLQCPPSCLIPARARSARTGQRTR